MNLNEFKTSYFLNIKEERKLYILNLLTYLI